MLGQEETAGSKLFEDNLEPIDRVIGQATRRLCILGEEAREFRAMVLLKLVDEDYAVLRKFRGRSRFTTYLSAVISNMARDYRVKRWGRWRPSAMANRLGLVAVQLETLIDRDGLEPQQAVTMVRENLGVKLSAQELMVLAERLPRRVRRRFESDEELLQVAARTLADERVVALERQHTARRIERILRQALAGLGEEECLLLRMRFLDGLTVAAIATRLEIDQRRLYARLERCLKRLRRALAAEEMGAREVREVTGNAELEIAFLDPALWQPGRSRPSIRLSAAGGADARTERGVPGAGGAGGVRRRPAGGAGAAGDGDASARLPPVP